MDKIKYVFWDSDNTLVDTAAHHWRKHAETLKSLGIALDEQYRRRVYENNGAQNWQWMTEELGLSLAQDDYLDRIDRWYISHIGEIAMRSGITEALAHFKAAGLPQAVVSNGRRRSVMAALEAKELAPYFEFILCKEDYEGRKPDPAPYLTALARMEERKGFTIDPATCLVVEDDPLGVQAGKAAGMQVIHRAMGDDRALPFIT
jgi:HAD superfamily hydrolase (TIGR01509 family)